MLFSSVCRTSGLSARTPNFGGAQFKPAGNERRSICSCCARQSANDNQHRKKNLSGIIQTHVMAMKVKNVSGLVTKDQQSSRDAGWASAQGGSKKKESQSGAIGKGKVREGKGADSKLVRTTSDGMRDRGWAAKARSVLVVRACLLVDCFSEKGNSGRGLLNKNTSLSGLYGCT